MKLNLLLAIITFFLTTQLYSSSLNAQELSYDDALERYNRGNHRESSIILRNLLQKDRNDLPSRILLANVLLQTGKFDQAEQQFRKAVSLGANKRRLLPQLIQSLLVQSKYLQALNEMESYQHNIAIESDLMPLYGRALVELKRLAEAEELYKSALDNNATRVEALVGLGLLYILNKKFEAAQSNLERAVALEPNNSIAWQLLGEISYQNEAFEKALEHVNKSLAINENDFRSKLLLAEIESQNGNYETAIKVVLDVLESQPDLPNANLLYAMILQKAGRFDDASQVARKLSSLLSKVDGDRLMNHPSLKLVLGLSYYMQERWESAYSHIIFYAKEHSNDEQSHLLAAHIEVERGRFQSALQILEQYTGTDRSELFIELKVNVLSNLKAFDKAYSELKGGIKQYPDSDSLKRTEVKVLLALGKIDEALIKLRDNSEALKFDDNMLILFSQLELGDKQVDAAARIINEMVLKSPNDPSVIAVSAGVDYQRKEFDSAERKLIKAIEIEPKFIPLYVNLHYVYVAKGKHKQALEVLTQALSVSPENANLWIKLGDFSAQLSNHKIASSWYRKAFDKTQNNKFAMLKLADSLINSNQADEAQTMLENLRQRYRLDPEFLSRLALSMVAANDCEQAIPVISLLEELAERSVGQLNVIARMYLNCHFLERSHNTLEKAEKNRPVIDEIKITRAEWFLTINRAKLALEVLSSIKTLNAKAKALTIRAYKALGENDKAFEVAVNLLKNTNEPFHAFRVLQFADLEAYRDKAIETVEVYLLNTENEKVREELALRYRKEGNIEKAKQHLHHLANKYANAQAYMHLAMIAAKSSPNDALSYAKKAYELEESNVKILDAYGWLLTVNNQPSDGLHILRNAFEREPKEPLIMYHLGETYYQLGRMNDAKNMFENVLAFEGFPHLSKIKQRLQNL